MCCLIDIIDAYHNIADDAPFRPDESSLSSLEATSHPSTQEEGAPVMSLEPEAGPSKAAGHRRQTIKNVINDAPERFPSSRETTPSTEWEPSPSPSPTPPPQASGLRARLSTPEPLPVPSTFTSPLRRTLEVLPVDERNYEITHLSHPNHAYELERAANISRNREMFASMGMALPELFGAGVKKGSKKTGDANGGAERGGGRSKDTRGSGRGMATRSSKHLNADARSLGSGSLSSAGGTKAAPATSVGSISDGTSKALAIDSHAEGMDSGRREGVEGDEAVVLSTLSDPGNGAPSQGGSGNSNGAASASAVAHSSSTGNTRSTGSSTLLSDNISTATTSSGSVGNKEQGEGRASQTNDVVAGGTESQQQGTSRGMPIESRWLDKTRWPDWLAGAYKYAIGKDLGTGWRTLIVAWVRLEHSYGFKSPTGPVSNSDTF